MGVCDQKEYSTGLCGCCADPLRCCFVCCCAPVAIGRLVGDMNDEGFNILSCLAPAIGAYRARRAIQAWHPNQPETPDESTLAICLCGTYAVCQDYREWKHLQRRANNPHPVAMVAAPPAVVMPPVYSMPSPSSPYPPPHHSPYPPPHQPPRGGN